MKGNRKGRLNKGIVRRYWGGKIRFSWFYGREREFGDALYLLPDVVALTDFALLILYCIATTFCPYFIFSLKSLLLCPRAGASKKAVKVRVTLHDPIMSATSLREL